MQLAEDDLNEILSDVVEIQDLHLNLDRRTGHAKGYAFVQVETQKDAESLIKEIDGKEMGSEKMKIDYAFKG